MGFFTNDLTTNSFSYKSENYITGSIETPLIDDGRVVSIIGTSIKGKSFIPQGFSNLNDFQEKLGTISSHYQKYQGRINSIFTSYVTLTSNAQLNYIKLLGIKKDTFDNQPGFNLDIENKKLYAIAFKIKKNNNKKNRYNTIIENDINDDDYVLLGYIVTDNNITISDNIDYDSNNKLYTLNLEKNNSTIIFDENSISNNDTQILTKIFSDNFRPPMKINFSFYKGEVLYWKNVFNMNIQRIKEFGYVFLNVNDISTTYENLIEENSECIIKEIIGSEYKDFSQGYRNAISPWFVSQGYYEKNQDKYRINDLDLKSRVKKLFRIHSKNEGEYGNNLIIQIQPISLGKGENTDNKGYSTFDIQIFDKKENILLESFTNLNLNPDDINYICRRIGDQKEYFDIFGSNRIVKENGHISQSKYIFVEVSQEVENKIISKETIPSGFIEKRRRKDLSFDNIDIKSDNHQHPYMIQPIFENTQKDSDNKNIKISEKHHWGHRIYSLKENSIDSLNSILLNPFTNIYHNSNITVPIVNEFEVKYYKYDLEKINENIKTNNYMTDIFFENIDNTNLTNEDIFHLEKIILTNEKNIITNLKFERWDLSLYNNKGDNILNEIDNEIGFNIDNDEKTFYYISLNKEDSNIDFSNLKFVAYMSEGWDGLNIFDVDQISLTNKGIENNDYLKELYKYAIDISLDNSNGLNNLIYFPGIYNEELINYASEQILNNDKFKSFLIFDLPFYDKDSLIVDYFDCLKLKEKNSSNTPLIWPNLEYEINSEKNIDEYTSLLMWKNYIKINKFMAGYSNYFNLLMSSNNDLNIKLNEDSNLVMPAGIIGLKYILDSNNIQSLTDLNLNINQLSDTLKIKNISNSFDESGLDWEKYIDLFKNIRINTLITRHLNSSKVLGFNNSKTLNFVDNRNQSVSNYVLYRLVLNEIKRVLENETNRRLIFQTISTKSETLFFNRQIYTNALNQIRNAGYITSYILKLDQYTTSDEDLLNNIVRGQVEVILPGKIVLLPSDKSGTEIKI